jgi:hypothetical protein
MTVEQFTDALIRVAIVALLVIAALQVFSPSMDLMLWALIFAITIYPSHRFRLPWPASPSSSGCGTVVTAVR